MVNVVPDEHSSSSSNISSESENEEISPTKRHKCTYPDCEAAFTRPYRLLIHIRSHTQERPFQCEEPNCDKAYRKKDTLKRHQLQSHLKQIENVVCSYEGCLQVMRKNSLRKHILRKHNSIRRFKFHCSECDKGFRSEYELKNHSTVHSAIYKCHMCEKVFYQGYRFRRHIKDHKSYKCLCEKKFFEHNVFLAHKRKCKICKPTCVICRKSFKNNANLKAHISTVHNHTTDRFECNYEGCDREYTLKKNLTAHIRDHHSGVERCEEAVLCSTCKKIFKNWDSFRKHNKNFHIDPKPKVNKPRKPRSDKGVPKVPMITVLTGFKVLEDVEENILSAIEIVDAPLPLDISSECSC